MQAMVSRSRGGFQQTEAAGRAEPLKGFFSVVLMFALVRCTRDHAGKRCPEYVDTAGCVRCHRDIVEAYSKTGMGRSFGKPQPLVGKLYHKASDRTYEIGDAKMTRYQAGPDGKGVNETESTIDYVIGSGNHARTFLHRNPDNSLTELPVSWYSEKGGVLAMSPGYDRPDQEDFRRLVPDDCLFCHNAYPRASNPLPEGIDCQRCHGPASDHKALINPAQLSRERQIDVCGQCHLEPTSSPPPSIFRQPGRALYSYRPGEPLSYYAVYFDANIGDRLFEAAHQEYRLRKSACFLKSQITCTTCHDPHREHLDAHFIAVCKTGHATAHNTDRNCLECHMWKRRTGDVPHAVMTDHYIQRRKPSVFSASQAAPQTGARTLYFPDQKPVTLYYWNGMSASKAGEYAAAIRWFEQPILQGDNAAASLRELAASLLLSGNLSRSAEEGAKVPNDPLTLTDLGNAYLQLGRVDDAKRVLQKAPEEPGANNLLGLALLKTGDTQGAEKVFRNTLDLQPDLAEAKNNPGNRLAARHSYGLALALIHDYREASVQLEEALRLAPGSAEIRSDLDDVRRSAR
jgi:Flp pilus assembly protein TadD